jgi:hypothetical protein
LHYSLVADCGIEHDVVYSPVGPYHVEILFQKSRALAIDRIHTFVGFSLALAPG